MAAEADGYTGAEEPDPLDTEPLEIASRITVASNATFLCTVAGTPVVYKPQAGEKPLWDFPDGDLADRERAAYLVSEAFGWDIVPRTWLRDGPLGPGMVQLCKTSTPRRTQSTSCRRTSFPRPAGATSSRATTGATGPSPSSTKTPPCSAAWPSSTSW